MAMTAKASDIASPEIVVGIGVHVFELMTSVNAKVIIGNTKELL
jgi:hypothetical protein